MKACGFLSSKSARDFSDFDIADISLIVVEKPNLKSDDGSSISFKLSVSLLISLIIILVSSAEETSLGPNGAYAPEILLKKRLHLRVGI
jgi:hypothetical protein